MDITAEHNWLHARIGAQDRWIAITCDKIKHMLEAGRINKDDAIELIASLHPDAIQDLELLRFDKP